MPTERSATLVRLAGGVERPSPLSPPPDERNHPRSYFRLPPSPPLPYAPAMHWQHGGYSLTDETPRLDLTAVTAPPTGPPTDVEGEALARHGMIVHEQDAPLPRGPG